MLGHVFDLLDAHVQLLDLVAGLHVLPLGLEEPVPDSFTVAQLLLQMSNLHVQLADAASHLLVAGDQMLHFVLELSILLLEELGPKLPDLDLAFGGLRVFEGGGGVLEGFD